MKNFFRALERRRVRYLLISGQATVLYGASTFSEDVDIWVSPTAMNWARLLNALSDSAARVYKLTPPLTRSSAMHGHGFHFTIPATRSQTLPGYLDVLGVVPRCGPFAACRRRARQFSTAWGQLPVIHPFDLVQIKRTRRLADYDVITALARLEHQRHPSRQTWQWALPNLFDSEERQRLWDTAPAAWRQSRCQPGLTPGAIAREIAAAQQQDRIYWQPIIAELKQLQRDNLLIPAGTLVSNIVQP